MPTARRKIECGKTPTRKSERLQNRIPLNQRELPNPKHIMTPLPRPSHILNMDDIKVENIKVEVLEFEEDIPEFSSPESWGSPETWSSPSSIFLANCHLCTGMFVQDQDGFVQHSGGNGCILANTISPVMLSANKDINCQVHSHSTEGITPPSTIDSDNIISTLDPDSCKDNLPQTPKSSLGKKRKRVRDHAMSDGISLEPDEILKKQKLDFASPSPPTTLDFNNRDVEIKTKDNKVLEIPQLWNCGTCRHSFVKQQEYMYHSCRPMITPFRRYKYN